jgi:glucose-1-phosphate thymidylyltransferase
MKGIVLAGGTGSRLGPITKSVSKQLLPVYDKPMIYYPISTLMLAGIREILIITTPHDQQAFQNLLGDGSNLGITFEYIVQENPDGLAQALIIGEDFLNGECCLLILGDNIFHGAGLGRELSHSLPNSGAHIFTYQVASPQEYGVLELDANSRPISITEKPQEFVSNLAITGLYFFDEKGPNIAKGIKPSSRGELEITSVLDYYLKMSKLSYTALTRGAAWLDTGNVNSLNDAASYIRVIEERTGLKVACLEEIALRNKWILEEELGIQIKESADNSYNRYIAAILVSELR